MTDSPLLELDDLRITRNIGRRRSALVDGVDLVVGESESVGLVGESGSGKSLSIKAGMRLLSSALESSGSIRFGGRDVMKMNGKELARYRASEVALIHQDPRAHINPTRTIGQFVVEGVVQTRVMNKSDAYRVGCELMRDVGIPDAERRMSQFPHELSGGLLQRVMIVAALLTNPKMIFADEPTTALDVTVQSDVMAILLEQVRDRHASMLFVTHDLDLAAAVTDRLAVMYAGRIVECGLSKDVYSRPQHPYTAALLQSRPSTTHVRRLKSIAGAPIAAYEVASGCSFAPRCPYATDRCRTERPEPRQVNGRSVTCHRAEELSTELQELAS
ncbi:ABC transporter ATP-binding protein [Rhodococcoides kroppenstedtii]|uniref:ABC transporter ATP-binding protein n=1 Tax=Rhodococcoides kroppenstedtii TaxID=293050 RepID=UPI0028EB2708|nr:ABC transporter ATP-binding protein [Rhodococcus kroppenstedtii]